jgi:serine/threonine-protein kinase
MNKYKPDSDIYIGKLLNSRYLIKHLLGKGGMGRVYLAEDTNKSGKLVAVKMLTFNLINQHMSERFGREIFIGAQLGKKSKNIVRILSYGVTEEQIPFYVMEYLQGKNLKQIIKHEPLKTPQFLDVCRQICLGLDCAHQGVNLKGETYRIVHRDIKPENIFIHQDAKEKEMVKILDFGIAKFLTERSGMTLTESFIGSLPYCSPEHMEGQRHLDSRSDIYSLGILMFEILTGKHPFQTKSNSFGTWYQIHCFQTPPSLEEINPQVKVPKELEKLVRHCLAKKAENRPQSVSEILDKLGKIQQEINDQYLKNINQAKNSQPVDESTLQLVPSTAFSEKECLQKSWPKNKPVALIGFPHLLHVPQGTVPTFWAMLPKNEISSFLEKTHNAEFISKVNVYPMVLWVTMLYDSNSSLIRWLSYYLDFPNPFEYKVVQSLAEMGYYHLLFFALEEPNKCVHVLTLSLSANQRQQLADAISSSYAVNENITSQQAKILLKAEYEKIKLEIIRKLETAQKNDIVGLKYWIGKLFDNFF